MAPPKRRRISGPSSTSAAKPNASQRTLSFGLTKSGASATANKVTKPFSLDNIGKVATKSLTTKDVLDVLTKDEPRKAQPQTTGKDTTLPPIDVESDAVFAETEEGKDCEEPEEDVAARALSERTINQYWQAKEIERKAPRVHQKGLSVREKVLREFDMSGSYGPSIGIPRLDRWRRAHRLRLNPPLEVLAVLLKEDGDGRADKVQLSIVDELMTGSRVTGDADIEI